MTGTKRPFGPVLGARVLVPRDGSKGKLTVSLGMPRQMTDHPDWECPFRLRGLGVNQVQLGCGVDALQAVSNALQGIRYCLDQLGTPLSWHPATSGNRQEMAWAAETGFHRFLPIGFGAFSRRLERLVDREEAALYRRLKRRHELREKRRRAKRTRR
jgi:hypothetical protein